MGKGQNEGGFSEDQLQMYKDCFKLMDINKDGQRDNSKMGKGQNEGGFSEDQLQMYKDCFKLMDINKDGTLDKNDLRGAFDNIGVLILQAFMAYDQGGKIDVNMFQEKMAGDGNDP